MDYKSLEEIEKGIVCKNLKCVHYEVCECMKDDCGAAFVHPDTCHYYENEILFAQKILGKYKDVLGEIANDQ